MQTKLQILPFASKFIYDNVSWNITTHVIPFIANNRHHIAFISKIICKFAKHRQLCGHISKSVFLLYPFKEIANFKSEKERAVKSAHVCRISTPAKGYWYPIRRGSGLFISLIGVWRCLLEDEQEIILRFFRIISKRQIRDGGDTKQNKWISP